MCVCVCVCVCLCVNRSNNFRLLHLLYFLTQYLSSITRCRITAVSLWMNGIFMPDNAEWQIAVDAQTRVVLGFYYSAICYMLCIVREVGKKKLFFLFASPNRLYLHVFCLPSRAHSPSRQFRFIISKIDCISALFCRPSTSLNLTLFLWWWTSRPKALETDFSRTSRWPVRPWSGLIFCIFASKVIITNTKTPEKNAYENFRLCVHGPLLYKSFDPLNGSLWDLS